MMLNQNPFKWVKIAFFDFWQKKSTVILTMLGVEFEKNKNITFLIYNKGIFFGKVDKQLHSSFKVSFSAKSMNNFTVPLMIDANR